VIEFRAQELHEDGAFREAEYAFDGTPAEGWTVLREGKIWLELPPGYEPLETVCCGICSTDQARRFLPFALPQIIGHEALAVDSRGRLVAAEINASCTALGLPEDEKCPLCACGLSTHCTSRLTLGIDRLPGGFGPRMLAPEGAVVPVPADLPVDDALLVEPFAAALHAAERIDLDSAETVAVLGAGRLGLLVVAALRALRDRSGRAFTIVVTETDRRRAALARAVGADELWTGPRNDPVADVVVEATGSVDGLGQALSMARREVHVKSTTGRETLGLRHLTAMVVDEISLAPLDIEKDQALWSESSQTALVFGQRPAKETADALEQRGLVLSCLAAEELPGAAPDDWTPSDVVVVSSLEMADRALRPWHGSERGLVRPRGTILIDNRADTAPLTARLFERHLRLTTSRCGDFERAFPYLRDLHRSGAALGERLITHRLRATDMAAAMKSANDPCALKVVVEHEFVYNE